MKSLIVLKISLMDAAIFIYLWRRLIPYI